MVLYFSGTGNSRYAAKRIAAAIGDGVISINSLMRAGGGTELSSQKAFVVVCPAYAWRIPTVVQKFLTSSEFKGDTRIYFILTCGSSAPGAARHAKGLAEELGLAFMGLAEVKMPDNYTALYNVSDCQSATKTLKNAEPLLDKIASLISEGQALPRARWSLVGTLFCRVGNKLFYRFFVKAKGFFASDKCTGCGECARLCPLNNITVVHGKPQWGASCTHCMACIGGCPVSAAQYKKRTAKRRRYYLTEDGRLTHKQ